MEEKRVFWLIAVISSLAAISAVVAYFVTRYLRAQTCEELLDDYCDCDYDDCDCDCDCDDEADDEAAEQPAEAESADEE